MTKRLRSLSLTTLVALCAASVAMTSGTSAASISCGQQVTTSTTLTADLGPCTEGIEITADNIVLDLSGHRIFGVTSTGDGAGVLFRNTTGSTVKGGTITGFDAGVVIDRGRANKVAKIRAFANVGEEGPFGDGILVMGSSNNRIQKSEVYGNGPFSGISIFAPLSDPADPNGPRIRTADNAILENSIHDNNVPASSRDMDDAGVRLESGTTATSVKRNRIAYNGFDGVTLFGGTSQNEIVKNRIVVNGNHDRPHRVGDGIRVFGSDTPGGNRIERNLLRANAGYGVYMDSGAFANVIKKNEARGNGLSGFASASPACLANIWRRNTGRSFDPPCTKGEA